MRWLRGSLLWFTAVLSSTTAQAEPQGHVGLSIGGGIRHEPGEVDPEGVFQLGLQGDLLFGRSGPDDFGAGPYLEVASLAFDDLHWGGGASLLLPIHPWLPLVLSLGGHGRLGASGDATPELVSSLFWGIRGYNHHGGYNLAAGLRLSFHQGLSDREASAGLLAAEVDLALLALPFVALGNWIGGPTSNASRRTR